MAQKQFITNKFNNLYKIIILFFVFFVTSIRSCGQPLTVKIIDKTIKSKKGKDFNVKRVRDSSGKKFYFVEKQKNEIFRISIYKNIRDTIFNFYFLNNAIAAIDISFKKNKKKYSIFYFDKDQVVYTKNGSVAINLNSEFLIRKSNNLLEEFYKQRKGY